MGKKDDKTDLEKLKKELAQERKRADAATGRIEELEKELAKAEKTTKALAERAESAQQRAADAEGALKDADLDDPVVWKWYARFTDRGPLNEVNQPRFTSAEDAHEWIDERVEEKKLGTATYVLRATRLDNTEDVIRVYR